MNVYTRFAAINTFVLDVDGVLTDGRVQLPDGGTQVRSMDIKDGLAIAKALKSGYHILVVSGGYSPPVLERLRYLGIESVFMAEKNKLARVEEFLKEKNLGWESVAAVGDDLPDLPLLSRAGLAVAPADAVREAKEAAQYISRYRGGAGCVRDLIEKVLRLRGDWNGDETTVAK